MQIWNFNVINHISNHSFITSKVVPYQIKPQQLEWKQEVSVKCYKCQQITVRLTWWDRFVAVNFIMRKMAVDTLLCAKIDIITIILKPGVTQ